MLSSSLFNLLGNLITFPFGKVNFSVAVVSDGSVRVAVDELDNNKPLISSVGDEGGGIVECFGGSGGGVSGTMSSSCIIGCSLSGRVHSLVAL